MGHFLSKVLDAILANVELTIVIQRSISRKLPGDHRDHSSRFKAYTFVLKTTKSEENRTVGTLDISF
jgi:hypothetical protein